MARFDPDFSRFKDILNGGQMTAYFHGVIGPRIKAMAEATTTKDTGRNAASFTLVPQVFSGPFNDRTQVAVGNMNFEYGAIRELGSKNNLPERSLYNAMVAVAGGRPVATPKAVRSGRRRATSRSFRRKP